MLPVGMLLAFLGYGVGSWGYILVRGWDIPLRQWFSPLNPYQWPAGGADPQFISPDVIFPGGASSTAAATPAPAPSPSTGGGAPPASGGGTVSLLLWSAFRLSTRVT